MVRKEVYLVLFLLLMLSFYGCVEIKYNAQQYFKEDGSSSLKIKEYRGVTKEFIASYESKYPKELVYSNPLAFIYLEYYRSKYFAQDICNSLSDDVSWLGRGWAFLLSSDWLLLYKRFSPFCSNQGVHYEPNW